MVADTCTWMQFSSRSQPVPLLSHDIVTCRSPDRKTLWICPTWS